MPDDISIHIPDKPSRPSPPYPHEATYKNKATVASLKSFGHTHEEIAAYLDIDDMTLVKHYKHELDTACTKANSAVANVLYKKAVVKEDLQAVIFWLKTRARWKEAKDETNYESLIEKLVDKLK